MKNNIVTMRRVEDPNKDNRADGVLFLEVEEEEEPEEVYLNAIPVEMKDTNLGNVLIEKKKEEKNILLKWRSMWKQKQQKEEETS
jgi:hypothetical protein